MRSSGTIRYNQIMKKSHEDKLEDLGRRCVATVDELTKSAKDYAQAPDQTYRLQNLAGAAVGFTKMVERMKRRRR
jgi:hypothetical protein